MTRRERAKKLQEWLQMIGTNSTFLETIGHVAHKTPTYKAFLYHESRVKAIIKLMESKPLTFSQIVKRLYTEEKYARSIINRLHRQGVIKYDREAEGWRASQK